MVVYLVNLHFWEQTITSIFYFALCIISFLTYKRPMYIPIGLELRSSLNIYIIFLIIITYIHYYFHSFGFLNSKFLIGLCFVIISNFFRTSVNLLMYIIIFWNIRIDTMKYTQCYSCTTSQFYCCYWSSNSLYSLYA